MANKKLIEAAGSGDHEGVSRALEEGAEITYRDWPLLLLLLCCCAVSPI